jgi:subtilisin family serine protease
LLDEVIARGIVVVTAQPQSADANAQFPAAHAKVLAAHSAADDVAPLSPYRLGAPGTEVLTTLPGASYAFLTGNSLAAAHMTGVVALLMEREPTLDVDRIAELLMGSTTFSGRHASINACRALERQSGAARICTHAPELARF